MVTYHEPPLYISALLYRPSLTCLLPQPCSLPDPDPNPPHPDQADADEAVKLALKKALTLAQTQPHSFTLEPEYSNADLTLIVTLIVSYNFLTLIVTNVRATWKVLGKQQELNEEVKAHPDCDHSLNPNWRAPPTNNHMAMGDDGP